MRQAWWSVCFCGDTERVEMKSSRSLPMSRSCQTIFGCLQQKATNGETWHDQTTGRKELKLKRASGETTTAAKIWKITPSLGFQSIVTWKKRAIQIACLFHPSGPYKGHGRNGSAILKVLAAHALTKLGPSCTSGVPVPKPTWS